MMSSEVVIPFLYTFENHFCVNTSILIVRSKQASNVQKTTAKKLLESNAHLVECRDKRTLAVWLCVPKS